MDFGDTGLTWAVVIENGPHLADRSLVGRIGEVGLCTRQLLVQTLGLAPAWTLVQGKHMLDATVHDHGLPWRADHFLVNLEAPFDFGLVAVHEHLADVLPAVAVRRDRPQWCQVDVVLGLEKQLWQTIQGVAIKSLVGVEHDDPIAAFAEQIDGFVPSCRETFVDHQIGNGYDSGSMGTGDFNGVVGRAGIQDAEVVGDALELLEEARQCRTFVLGNGNDPHAGVLASQSDFIVLDDILGIQSHGLES